MILSSESLSMQQDTAPKSMDEFYHRLQDARSGMPKRLLQCADYITENSEMVAVSTVAEMAAAAGVQPSAFIRFCKLLGFSGFSQLQRLFRDHLAPQWPDYATRLTNLKQGGAENPANLLAQFIEAGNLSLENLAHTVNPAILDQAVAALARANMIHIIGLQRAFPVATYLAYAFEKMHIPAMLHDAVGKLDHRHAIRSGDVLIAITFAPYSPETLALAEHAATLSCPVVAITDKMEGIAPGLNALKLAVLDADVADFRTLSATLTLAITLAVSVGAAR